MCTNTKIDTSKMGKKIELSSLSILYGKFLNIVLSNHFYIKAHFRGL